jgi:hypothetical protein
MTRKELKTGNNGYQIPLEVAFARSKGMQEECLTWPVFDSPGR